MHPRTAILWALLLIPSVIGIAPGLLNIRRDEEIANEKMYMWRSYVVFNEDIQNDWTDGELAGLATQAFLDMNTGLVGIGPKLVKKQRPGVMTAIALGRTVSFASSIKTGGKSFLYNSNVKGGKFSKQFDTTLNARAQMCSTVARALTACQMLGPRVETFMGHRTWASCGEEMASYQICMTHTDPQFLGGKVVSVTSRDDPSAQMNVNIVAPCSREGAMFGCTEFTGDQGLGMYVVPDNTAIVARDPVAGALSCTQPSFCQSP